MYRILSAFLLLIITGTAFAEPNIRHIADSLVPPPTDYSVAYLGQIFGNVGGVLHGMSGQVLGKVFEVFNKGVMVVAALWLGYTTVTLALKAAQEGSFLGQNRNVPVLFLRVALGFALIIPSPATGYSVLQDIFMKIVIAGVGLADNTWDAALNYMSYGGSLYIAPKALNNDSDLITKAFGDGDSAGSYGPLAQILLGEACMFQANKNHNPNVTPIYVSPNLSTGAGGYVYFPGQISQGDSPTYTTTGGNTTAPCGGVESFYKAQKQSGQGGFNTSSYPQKQLDQLQITSWTALRTLTQKMLPVAKAYVKGSMSSNNLNNMTFTALLSYVSMMSSYQKAFTSSGPSKLPFLDQAKTQGWIMAGRFYWDIEQANGNASASSISKLFPSFLQPGSSSAHDANAMGYAEDSVVGTSSTSSSLGTFFNSDQTNINAIKQLWENYVGAQQNTVGSYTSAAGQSWGNSTLNQDLSDDMQKLVSGVSSLSSGQGYNPIAVLMNEGNVILEIIVGIWTVAIISTVAISAVAGICNSTSPGGLIAKTALAWVKAIVVGITMALVVPGVILGYYVPLFPYIVFTFAAIGWIVLVIEGMAAAPLVCMGLTHPEGHDFLGKAEQALMLFLGIFLRPALLIVGLIASMLLSFVAFHMLIIGFEGILQDITHSANSPFGDPLLILFSVAMVLVLFGMLTMEVIEQCFKVTYQLPNNIMRWIGGPQMGEEYGQVAQAVKGAVSGAGQSASGAMSQAGSAVDQSTADWLRNKAAKEDSNINLGAPNGAGTPPEGGGGSDTPGGGTPPAGVA